MAPQNTSNLRIPPLSLTPVPARQEPDEMPRDHFPKFSTVIRIYWTKIMLYLGKVTGIMVV